jgi:hypothetical protein
MVRTSMLLQYAQIHVTIRLFDYNQVTPKNYDDKYTCKFKIIYRTCHNRMTHMNIIYLDVLMPKYGKSLRFCITVSGVKSCQW